MSVETDAILCYGFPLTDDDGCEEISLSERFPGHTVENDIDECIASIYGHKALKDFDVNKYNTDAVYRETCEENWSNARKIVNTCGITIVKHCSNSYPLYLVVATDSVSIAGRGYPHELGQNIESVASWKDVLEDFCKRTNITFVDPQFLLCSHWGDE